VSTTSDGLGWQVRGTFRTFDTILRNHLPGGTLAWTHIPFIFGDILALSVHPLTALLQRLRWKLLGLSHFLSVPLEAKSLVRSVLFREPDPSTTMVKKVTDLCRFS
jgi:hypothetical protein